jgi:hypothetical protein
MGRAQAEGMASLTDLTTAVSWHLRSNHYPPIHDDFVPVALKAIYLAGEGEYDAELEYPNGLVRTVAHTIEGLHLSAFLDEE